MMPKKLGYINIDLRKNVISNEINYRNLPVNDKINLIHKSVLTICEAAQKQDIADKLVINAMHEFGVFDAKTKFITNEEKNYFKKKMCSLPSEYAKKTFIIGGTIGVRKFIPPEKAKAKLEKLFTFYEKSYPEKFMQLLVAYYKSKMDEYIKTGFNLIKNVCYVFHDNKMILVYNKELISPTDFYEFLTLEENRNHTNFLRELETKGLANIYKENFIYQPYNKHANFCHFNVDDLQFLLEICIEHTGKNKNLNLKIKEGNTFQVLISDFIMHNDNYLIGPYLLHNDSNFSFIPFLTDPKKSVDVHFYNYPCLQAKCELVGPLPVIDPTISMLAAIRQRNLEKIARLLLERQFISIEDEIKYWGTSTLHELISNYRVSDDIQIKMLNMLLQDPFYAAQIDTRNKDGYTPLYLASLWQDKTSFFFLLEKGANPNIPDSLDVTILYRSVYEISENEDNLNFLAVFLSKANPNYATKGYYPLALAISCNKLKMAELLLKHQANPDWSTPRGTPLVIAIKDNNVEAVKLLLNYFCNPNQPYNGTYPLEYALMMTDAEAREIVVKELSWKGANKYLVSNPSLLEKTNFFSKKRSLQQDVSDSSKKSKI